ncbi:MAG: glycosyltransferase [Clostridia bacterium]|nr:glycosyltransferase [Clostridia bacterium]
MKVLHILNSNKYSGAENVVITIIKNMPQNFECCYLSCSGPIEKTLLENGIRFKLVDKLSINAIKRVVKEFSPDIIHAHDFKASVLASKIKFKGVLISHIHNNNPFMRTWNLKSFLYFTCIKKFKYILGVSNSILTECVYNEKMSAKFENIGNPIDIDSLNSLYEKKQKIYDIIFVGRLSEEKDPLRFINIIKQIQEQNKQIKVVMIGDGELMPDVLREINKYNLNNVIEVLGFKDNPFEYILKSKIMFMTSKWEGFGLVVVEALSMHVPVACTRVGGMPELISEKSGQVCDDDKDFIDFYNKLQDDLNYEAYSEGAFLQALKLGNIKEYIKKLTDFVYPNV